VSADGADQGDVGGAVHGGHLGPVGLGELDREGADTAGRPVDQDLVAGLEVSVAAKALDGGCRRHRQRGRVVGVTWGPRPWRRLVHATGPPAPSANDRLTGFNAMTSTGTDTYSAKPP